MADTIALTAPTTRAMCTGTARKESRLEYELHATQFTVKRRVLGNLGVVLTGFGHHQHSPVQLEHVDVMPIERAQDVGTHDFVGGAARRASVREIDNAVHDGQQCIHLVRREQARRRGDRWPRGEAGRRSPGRSWGPGSPAARRATATRAHSRGRGRSARAVVRLPRDCPRDCRQIARRPRHEESARPARVAAGVRREKP